MLLIHTEMAESVAQRITEKSTLQLTTLTLKMTPAEEKASFMVQVSLCIRLLTSHISQSLLHLIVTRSSPEVIREKFLNRLFIAKIQRPKNDTYKLFTDSLRLDDVKVYQTSDLMLSLQENDGQVPT